MKHYLLATLLFISSASFAQRSTITITDIAYTKTGSSFTLSSPEISSFTAYDSVNSINVTVYTYNNSTNKATGFSISTGWALYGECLVYGVYIVGDNNVTIFIPCSQCVGLAPFCPDAGNGLCRLSFELE